LAWQSSDVVTILTIVSATVASGQINKVPEANFHSS